MLRRIQNFPIPSDVQVGGSRSYMSKVPSCGVRDAGLADCCNRRESVVTSCVREQGPSGHNSKSFFLNRIGRLVKGRMKRR